MNVDRVERLTEKQRECLRLVYAHLSSKEIAPRLRVEPGTVDQYIKAAMRILGVADRRAAARMLAEHEAKTAQPLVYQPLDIADSGDSAMFGSSTGGQRTAALDGAMREDRAEFQVHPTPSLESLKLPLPIRETKPSDLGPLLRLGWILALLILIALAFGVFITGFEALSRLGRTPG